MTQASDLAERRSSLAPAAPLVTPVARERRGTRRRVSLQLLALLVEPEIPSGG